MENELRKRLVDVQTLLEEIKDENITLEEKIVELESKNLYLMEENQNA